MGSESVRTVPGDYDRGFRLVFGPCGSASWTTGYLSLLVGDGDEFLAVRSGGGGGESGVVVVVTISFEVGVVFVHDGGLQLLDLVIGVLVVLLLLELLVVVVQLEISSMEWWRERSPVS